MLAFEVSEATLVSRYLEKNHDFRHGSLTVQRRAFLAAWDPAPIFTIDRTGVDAVFAAANVTERTANAMNWFPFVGISGGDYLLGYGGGFGSACTAYGIGATGPSVFSTDPCPTACLGFDPIQNKFLHNFVDRDSRVVFVNLFGSYFGSWDQPDDFLRAPLANPYDPANSRHGYGLTSIWGKFLGLEQTSLAQRALGACIGESVFKGYAGPVNYALMGDPTLRMHTVSPPTDLVATRSFGIVFLTWVASSDPAVSGYNVYSSPTANGPLTLVNPADSLVTASSFQALRPSGLGNPDNYYLVRAVKTETTPIGSYVNLSEGAIVSPPGAPTPWLQILHGPASRSVTVGAGTETVTFATDAVGIDASGNETLSFQWSKSGNPNPLVSDGTHTFGAATRSLTIVGVQLTDAGNYQVVVRTASGMAVSASASLTTN